MFQNFTQAMRWRAMHLVIACALVSAPSAFSQSMPAWKSSLQTGNIKDIVPSAGGDNSVAAWLGKKADVLSCRTRDKDIFLGGNNSVSQLVDGSRYANVVGTGRVSLYLSAFAVNNLMAYGDALGGPIGIAGSQKITANFSPYAPGISEEWYDKYGTPSLPASAHNDGGVGDTVNGPLWYAQIGFRPTIMLMNINTNGSDADNLAQFQTASSDIKRGYTSVKYVWPYINDYAGQHSNWTSDAYWAGRKKIIQYAGGVGIDVPAGIGYQDPHWMPSIINEIRWANANNLHTVVLLTPFNTDPATSQAGGQFSFDADFEAHTKWFVGKLRAANALPSAWIVSNYSNWGKNSDGSLRTANMVGADTDTAGQSVAAVARWVAENAPTSPYVALPAGSEGGRSVPCAVHVEGGVTGPNQTIGAQTLGLGSLAYQDIANLKIDNLTVDQSASIGSNLTVNYDLHVGNGAFFGNSVSLKSGNAIVLGYDTGNPAYLGGDGAGNATLTGSMTVSGNASANGDSHVGGTGFFGNGVSLKSGTAIALGYDKGNPAYFGGDGAGNATLTGSMAVSGNASVNGDAHVGGTGFFAQDIRINSGKSIIMGFDGATPVYFNADGKGVSTLTGSQIVTGTGTYYSDLATRGSLTVNGYATIGAQGGNTHILNAASGTISSTHYFACLDDAGLLYRSSTACN